MMLFQSVVPPSIPKITSLHKNKSSLKISSYYFYSVRSSFHTITSYVRKGYQIQNTSSLSYSPQATFLFISEVFSLSPFVDSAVALMTSSWGLPHYRLLCFSICRAFFFSFFSSGKINSKGFDLQHYRLTYG
jgi:hypothetical protein